MQHPKMPEGDVNKRISVAGATQNAEIKYKTFITFDDILCWHSYMFHKHHNWVFFPIKSVIVYPKCNLLKASHFLENAPLQDATSLFKITKVAYKLLQITSNNVSKPTLGINKR